MPDGPGRVYLVGAGPGDPGLITARALELIARADVILYDRLIPPEALAGARAGAELRYVGKEGGGESVPQGQTEELMVARARDGLAVVRLKGGDPFVFGRGGEEALALRAAGIPFEVVPGVTAGAAAAAYAGIPVTQRELASAVAFVTGHEDPDKPEATLDWAALAAFPGTLVFYMGVAALPRIAERLLAAGRARDEPAAVVQRGTLPDQRTVLATLGTVSERAHEEGVRPPSITVIGPVAGLAEQLAWRSPGPLAGLTVTVTRARAQASELAARLGALGAQVVQAPAIRIVALDAEVPDLSAYDLVCFTSANGVQQFFARLEGAGRDVRALGHARVAAIGAGTAAELRRHGVIADIAPERSVGEGLVEALSGVALRRVLVARAREARDVLPDALRHRGAEVDVLALYETVPETLDAGTLGAARASDYVTFTSSSTVRLFLAACGGPPALSPRTRIASIGPVTSQALREQGMTPDVEADPHDLDGLIAALVADADERR